MSGEVVIEMDVIDAVETEEDVTLSAETSAQLTVAPSATTTQVETSIEAKVDTSAVTVHIDPVVTVDNELLAAAAEDTTTEAETLDEGSTAPPEPTDSTEQLEDTVKVIAKGNYYNIYKYLNIFCTK